MYNFRLLAVLCQTVNMKAFLLHVAVIKKLGHFPAWYSKTADVRLDKLIKNMVLMITNVVV